MVMNQSLPSLAPLIVFVAWSRVARFTCKKYHPGTSRCNLFIILNPDNRIIIYIRTICIILGSLRMRELLRIKIHNKLIH